jgi:hypothetical protein
MERSGFISMMESGYIGKELVAFPAGGGYRERIVAARVPSHFAKG